MAKITIFGDALVITSGRTLEDIKTLEKYSPKSLSLYEADEEGHKSEVFRVCSSKKEGNISKYGATFSNVARDGSGMATITLPIPPETEDAVGYVSDKYGLAIMRLNEVEAQFDAALETISAQKAAILNNIVIG